jgi:hypothetical protein
MGLAVQVALEPNSYPTKARITDARWHPSAFIRIASTGNETTQSRRNGRFEDGPDRNDQFATAPKIASELGYEEKKTIESFLDGLVAGLIGQQ